MQTWKTLLWARAIENLVYISCSQNLFGEEKGFSYIMGPEKILGENLDEGILLSELDLGRLEFLRTEKVKVGMPKETYQTIPGLLSCINTRKIFETYLPK